MSKDTCIKANTYCPVHKGIVGADCWHDSKDFSVPRTDWKQVDEINTLREQVEKLTKERDDLRSRRCEVCGYLEHEREHTGCLREQLAALAEQNEKLRKVLLRLACLGNGDQYGNSIGNYIAQEALSLPNLASPVLNRIRAEGMRMAAEICDSPMDRAAAQKICAKADELGQSNG